MDHSLRRASGRSAGTSAVAIPCQTWRRRPCLQAYPTASPAAAPPLCRPSPCHSAQRKQPGRDVRAAGLGPMPENAKDWREEVLGPEAVDENIFALSQEEIEDRVNEAAAIITVVHDLRTLKSSTDGFNASLEIWRRIKQIPPWCRHHLLSELEPGAVRSLWKASMSRYVLDDTRALDLAGGYTIWQDLPSEPQQVFTYRAKCEKFVYVEPQVRFFVDEDMQERFPRETPWLKPAQGSLEVPAQNFKVLFFVQPGTGQLFGRVLLPWWGPLDRWWLPCYMRLNLELQLTPLKEDAGADFTFEYPCPGTSEMKNWLGIDGLLKEHLPHASWPAPDAKDGCGSPFSLGTRDYVRVAGPGVYVGCAYRSREPGIYNEEDCIYFVLVRQMSKQDYIQQAEAEAKH